MVARLEHKEFVHGTLKLNGLDGESAKLDERNGEFALEA